MEWRKAPSVTRGGKPYFWTGVHKGTRYWVVWDRQRKMWAVDKESIRRIPSLAWFPTPAKAKKFVEGL